MAAVGVDLDGAVLAIEAEVASPFGSADRVREACARLGSRAPGPGPSLERLAALAGAAARRAGDVVTPVAELLHAEAARAEDPWPVLEPLLSACAPAVASAALEVTARLAGAARLEVTPARLARLAGLVEAPDSPFLEAGCLARIGVILSGKGREPAPAELTEIWAGDAAPGGRRLAARLLDAAGELPGAALAERMLGTDAAGFLAPYLAFTRATHLDLLDLVSAPRTPPPALASFRRAEALCGEALLREIFARLGWSRVNAGLAIEPYVGLEADGAFPLLFPPREAALVENEPGVRRAFERWLVVAHGGTLAPAEAPDGADDVGAFRTLNLLHADALADILDVAPLTSAKVVRILDRMERIVRAFLGLFAREAADECRLVADVHGDLDRRVRRELAGAADGRPLSAEATRLVQAFEDPRTAGDVRTLHGLKRFLHQRGLRLGFRLAESGRGTNRTVDLAVVTPPRVTQVFRAIAYADFEPEPRAPGEEPVIPWAVRVAAEGFGRQLLHGLETLPKARVFCYGNEVHAFLAFANHPVFVRMDLAPPLRGGMVDLEYYGVSRYQLDAHPNPSLDGLLRFFRRLDVAAEVESTRIHARYDKERAADLSALCERVEALFRLAPYLMDVDWVIGGLALDAEARAAVAEAWADFFARWGVLPVSRLLTADRVGILVATVTDAAGTREVRWDGRGPYRDRFSAGPPAAMRARLVRALGDLGLPRPRPDGNAPLAQLALETELLAPLRAGVARGEIAASPGGFSRAPAETFERRHEASWFADLLLGDAGAIARASRMARLVSSLQPHLRFQTSGSVNGYEVQRAELPLSGTVVTVHVLRDAAGVVRLARAGLDGAIARSRDGPGASWRESPALDVDALETRLRAHNVPAAVPVSPEAGREEEELRAEFACPNPNEAPRPGPGERVVAGIAAAPGRASGLARLGLRGREPEDVEGAIVLTASLRPDDAPFLRRAAGVVSTGGGVLSHAGLLALQLGKPALVAGGLWENGEGSAPAVVCRRAEHEEASVRVGDLPVVELRNATERDDRIRDGDLVTLDADAGVLRILGRDRDALALHDGLAQLVAAARRLPDATDDGEILALRGRRLRARHQIGRLLARMEDAVLARHAVSELLAGEAAEAGGDPASLLPALLGNAAVGSAARTALRETARELERRHASSREAALAILRGSRDAWEILTLRRDVARIRERLVAATASIAASGLDPGPPVPDDADVDRLAAERLADIRTSLAEAVAREELAGRRRPRLRHVLAQIARIDAVLGASASARDAVAALARRSAADDENARRSLADRWIVLAGDGGAELRPLVGSKAAALAECARLGEGSAIPAWFAVTDRAFREVMAARVPAATCPGAGRGELTVAEAIDVVLSREEEPADARFAAIRKFFASAPLPPGLGEAVAEAYGRLGPGADPFVAIRSSAVAEDTEEEARPGEFDTFLFVRGPASVLEHVRLAWAGLWSPRALRARTGPGAPADAAAGGILVQRMVDARVSGVLNTVHLAASRPREMLVNAGLGLGEGVVSGLVAADQITVAKDASVAGDDLRFRYVTHDKRERVVFNSRSGTGTARVETLYHQRLRPALEYVELLELVHAAARLEAAFGHPLDVEFAIEGSALWLLQVRPVPAALAVWRETAERYPFRTGGLR